MRDLQFKVAGQENVDRLRGDRGEHLYELLARDLRDHEFGEVDLRAGLVRPVTAAGAALEATVNSWRRPGSGLLALEGPKRFLMGSLARLRALAAAALLSPAPTFAAARTPTLRHMLAFSAPPRLRLLVGRRGAGAGTLEAHL